jgi:hypothetical protein
VTPNVREAMGKGAKAERSHGRVRHSLDPIAYGVDALQPKQPSSSMASTRAFSLPTLAIAPAC